MYKNVLISALIVLFFIINNNAMENQIELDKKLYQTIQNKKLTDSEKIAQLNGLIEKGANVNVGFDNKISVSKVCLLSFAINRQASLEILRFLVDKGADPNEGRIRRITPLIYLVRAKYENIDYCDYINLLIDNGADVNIQDICGNTPLHEALIRDNFKMVNALISIPNINIRINNKDKKTALALYIEKDKVEKSGKIENNSKITKEMFEFFTKERFEFSYGKKKNRKGESIQDKYDYKNEESLKNKLNNFFFNDSLPSFQAYQAILRGDKESEIISLLKNPKVDLEFKTIFKTTLLHEAVIKGFPEVVKWLLDNGLSPEEKDVFLKIPLHYAIEKNAIEKKNYSLIRLLMPEDLKQKGPLSCFGYNHTILSYFIANKYNIYKLLKNKLFKSFDFKKLIGQEEIFAACEALDIDLIKDFRKAGHNFNFINSLGYSPCSVFIVNLHLDSQSCVKENFSDIDYNLNLRNEKGENALHCAAKNNHEDLLEFIIENISKNIADLSVQDNKGNTPLHYASKKGHLDVAERLINSDANLNVQNNKGNTPLHYASKKDNKAIAQLLIDYLSDNNKDADMNTKNKDGDTPLHWATKYGHLDIVKLLIEGDVDLEIQNNKGNTPLHYAYKKGRLDIVKRLIGLRL